jgi:phosphatidylglycerophosphate synthase
MTSHDRPYLRTLFLHPPSYAGFDGGAGSRYQARREIRSFWYPTWLAQPAALVPGSRLIDAPPEGLTLEQVRPMAAAYELAILHTSTPSFADDVRVAEALKAENPALRIGVVGAHVAVNPTRALAASDAIEFVARNEFDFTIQEVAQGRPLDTILGLSFRTNGAVRHTPDRPVLEDMDALPFVVDVYHRDLVIEHYAVEHVASEIAAAIRYFPQVREYFFDDDTLTDDLPRVEALARRLGKLGITWSCNAKANVPSETLKVMKDNGLRLLLVGYESGNQKILNNVKKGIRLETARQFTRQAKALGIKIHGTFILGLPGETRETIAETIRFARDIDPDTIQVSIAAPYPGTELFRQALANGWLTGDSLVDARGAQVSALSYPHLASTEISRGTEEFYRRFYFRPRKIFAITKEMIADRHVMRRRLREGREFLQFLSTRSTESSHVSADAVEVPLRTARPASLQVVLSVPARSPMIASVPAAVRTAHDVAAIPGVTRMVLCTESPGQLRRWRRPLAGRPWTEVSTSGGSSCLADALDPACPVMVLARDAMPDPCRLHELVTHAMAATRRSTWTWRGAPLGTYYPEASMLLELLPSGSRQFPRDSLSDPDAAGVNLPPDGWDAANDRGGIRRAERRLFDSLRRPADGYLARVDRALSIALSRLLIRTPITPNVITGVGAVVGLAGAVLLGVGASWLALLGAILVWVSCILDGCDGEVARLKLLSSPFGARFDVATDNVVHMATFAAIILYLHRRHPELALAAPAIALFLGLILSMWSMWWVINRRPWKQRIGVRRIYERVAGRDYVYIVVALTAVDRLEWFGWAAAIGANVFWLSLWCSSRAQHAR